MNALTENIHRLVSPPIREVELSFAYQESDYLQFLRAYNGGYFFTGALHLYGFDSIKDWHDVLQVNALIQKSYAAFNFSKTFYSFGCDIFFNQYGFHEGKVVMLDIYSGELAILASSFKEWLALLINDGNYYSGQSLLAEWINKHGLLNNAERLAATIPFIVGGEYKVENLYAAKQEELLSFAAYFANEIKDLPDGTSIKLIVQ